MRKVLLFFFKYFLYWFCFFILFKILFLAANFSKTVQIGWADFFKVFLYGSKMDFSVAGYFTLLPGVLLFFTSAVNPKIINWIIRGYTLVLIVVVTILGLIDIALFPAWGTRLNAQILPYLANPVGVIACVSWWQIILFLVLFGAIGWGTWWFYNRIFRTYFQKKEKPRWYTSPVILVLTAALIIPIRGGFDASTLNFSSVYFSPDLYTNQCAYNYFWSFNHGIMHNKLKANPVHYYADSVCEKNIEGVGLLYLEKPPVYIKQKTDKPVNVVLVILESFSDKVIEPLGGLPGLTPRLNQYCHEGILFSEFYATGNRSDKGISSLLASYPALIKASSIIFFPDKMKKLHYLPNYFKNKGYDLSFYYGGDVNFYNTRMLLIQSGVEEIISKNDFPHQISSLQNWGVPDQYLYQRMYDDLLTKKQPFLSMVYNISSHEPFDIPEFNRIKDNSSSGKYCNSVAYSDSCLGNFIDQLKASPLWENTLVIITSDHTTSEPGHTALDDTASYRIPLLWFGGVIDTAFVSPNIAMQTDLSTTLIQQLGWEPEPSFFSKNIFGSRQYAFFIRDAGWGFLSPETGFFMNLESGKRKFYYGEGYAGLDSLTRFSESYVQYLHSDFLKK